MSKPTTARLHGYAKSPLGVPGMVIPVYQIEDRQGWYVQETGRNGRVAGFEEIELSGHGELMAAMADVPCHLSIGDEPVYAVALDEEQIMQGTMGELASKLDFTEPRLAVHPALRADLAEFVGNQEAFERALRDLEDGRAQQKALQEARERSRDRRRWNQARPGHIVGHCSIGFRMAVSREIRTSEGTVVEERIRTSIYKAFKRYVPSTGNIVIEQFKSSSHAATNKQIVSVEVTKDTKGSERYIAILKNVGTVDSVIISRSGMIKSQAGGFLGSRRKRANAGVKIIIGHPLDGKSDPPQRTAAHASRAFGKKSTYVEIV